VSAPPARNDTRSGAPSALTPTDPHGRPVAVEVFGGNTADPTAFTKVVERIRGRFGLKRLVLVGDRGMITSARVEALRELGGMGWITCLRAAQIRQLGSPQSSQEVPAETHRSPPEPVGDGDTAEGSVFRGSGDLWGWSPENRRSGLAAGGAAQGRGRPPPATRRHFWPGPLLHGRSGPGFWVPSTLIGWPSPNQHPSCGLYPSRASSLRSSLRGP
jgi:Transposase DDE domain